jgi:membrane-bound lytic murein transglycosylase D
MRPACFFIGLYMVLMVFTVQAREITFCGERIPVNNAFVANRLMDVIRQQAYTANLHGLRRDARRYFPFIEYCLRVSGMPEDLKYIPIVESGFRNATSKAGAQGFWQLMPNTARDWGLQVNETIDERNDIYKSTIAAMRELARTFKNIRKTHNITSWVLTAAAYNWGIGNIFSRIERGNRDYFTMPLNPETAVYVYKIIAIKELFEYPELYLKNFKYNVFSSQKPFIPDRRGGDEEPFKKMELNVNTATESVPEDDKIKDIPAPKESDLKKSKEAFRQGAKLVSARIVGRYPDFKDGDAITLSLQDDLQTVKGFQRKGTEITGKGWLIDGRVFVDLGFDTNDVILYDTNSEQGIATSLLKNKQQVILRVQY